MTKVKSLTVIILLLAVIAIVLMPALPDLNVDLRPYPDTAAETAFDLEHNRMLAESMFVDVGTTYSHAETKHPGALECMEGKDVIQVWENPFSNHCAEVKQIDEHHFGIRIIAKIKGKFEEITAFTDEVEGLWEVEQYLIDGSYMQIWGAP